MAKNYVQRGDTITLEAPGNVSSGDGVLVGTIFGVALYDAETGDDVEVAVTGVWDIVKNTNTGSGWSQGDLLYWEPDSDKMVDTPDTNSVLIGVAVEDAADGAATGRVRLNGTFGVPLS